MSFADKEKLENRPSLKDLPIFAGQKLLTELPSKEELFDDMIDTAYLSEPLSEKPH